MPIEVVMAWHCFICAHQVEWRKLPMQLAEARERSMPSGGYMAPYYQSDNDNATEFRFLRLFADCPGVAHRTLPGS
jgi:hypothetical protein